MMEHIRDESNPPESKKAIGTSAISLFWHALVRDSLTGTNAS